MARGTVTSPSLNWSGTSCFRMAPVVSVSGLPKAIAPSIVKNGMPAAWSTGSAIERNCAICVVCME